MRAPMLYYDTRRPCGSNTGRPPRAKRGWPHLMAFLLLCMASTVLWLSTFPDEVRYKVGGSSRRHYLNRAALTEGVHPQLQDEAVVPAWASTQAVLPAAAILGAVRVVPDGVYHHLLCLESSEREQYHLWQQQL
eukprot:16159927-Heterocapsa_arctica.AAC.1